MAYQTTEGESDRIQWLKIYSHVIVSRTDSSPDSYMLTGFQTQILLRIIFARKPLR
jgi:hypothetical protein